jgi:hypothetical protein
MSKRENRLKGHCLNVISSLEDNGNLKTQEIYDHEGMGCLKLLWSEFSNVKGNSRDK